MGRTCLCGSHLDLESPSATRLCHFFFADWKRGRVYSKPTSTSDTRELLREAMTISTAKRRVDKNVTIINSTNENSNAQSENVISQPNYAHTQTVRTRPSWAGCEAIVLFVMGHDVFAVFATGGYGKSLCYACLPRTFLRSTERASLAFPPRFPLSFSSLAMCVR